ncbi:hypothetical protein [Streptomyces xantholiticus]|uniref:hypothetical protein n=1 Tax=Streptomyces xantholiticus TaxID=68285 RepID=UPI0019944911|nr:hypothetical protein [Streptomyces xantholiticus]GGW31092.1 hypothetical protein GCM10010381_14510 [Streptomyces xantholiticus]
MAAVVSRNFDSAEDDGGTADAEPGQFVTVAPGHDAYVVGDEPCVMPDWVGSGAYAKALTREYQGPTREYDGRRHLVAPVGNLPARAGTTAGMARIDKNALEYGAS